MTLDALLAIGIVAGVVVVLAANLVAVEAAMLAGLVLMILAGIVEPGAGLQGFAHPAPLSIAALFVVAAGLRVTGATVAAAPYLLGHPGSLTAAHLRLMGPVAVLSAFLNNTPVVAMYLPLVREWAERIRVSPSRLLIPLSFSSILGGQLTVIGSASNLIVMGLYIEYLNDARLPLPGQGLRFWGPAVLGLPAAPAGIAYLTALSRRLIPDRVPLPKDRFVGEEYTVEMSVPEGSPLAGTTIASSGVGRRDGLHLYRIVRGGHMIHHPDPETPLRVGDRLGFAGSAEAVVNLQNALGLAPSGRSAPGAVTDPGNRELVEAVISARSPLTGHTVREATTFGPLFNAAVVALRRSGVALLERVGDIRLRAGDTLLLEAPRGFARAYRSSSHFYLVSVPPGFERPRHDRLRRAAVVFGLVIAGLTTGVLEPVVVCLGGALLIVFTGCLSARRALGEVSWPVIVTIATAIGMGIGLERTGAAGMIAGGMLDAGHGLGLGNQGMLFAIILLATIFAQFIHKNAVAALMFPVAAATANELGVHVEPFAFGLIFACGLSFLSPVSYQTNLMVYGPGGYKFLDFPRVGAPLTLALAALATILCPLVFPFRPIP